MSSLTDLVYKLHRNVVVDLGDDQHLTIKYALSNFDRTLIKSIDEVKDDSPESVFRQLSGVMVGWELDDPCTPENIDKLGFYIQNKILLAIQADIKEISGTKKDSADGSSSPD